MIELVDQKTEPKKFSEFLDLPWSIYPGRHLWVPPLKAALSAELSNQNPFFTHGEVQLFIFRKNGKVVGRIVASIDSFLKDQDVGHFGYFECIDDVEVAQELLKAAQTWLKGKGKRYIHGPVDLSIFQNYRLQTHGFDRNPFYSEPRAPEYYQRLLKACGYTVHGTWNSWDLDKESVLIFRDAMSSMTSKFENELSEYKFSTFDQESFEFHCRALHSIVLETFSSNYGFSGITEEEYVQKFSSARHVICDAAQLVQTLQQETVGYCYSFLDPSEAFARADGKIENFSFELTRRPQTVLHTFGIKKPHRKRGIAEMIFRNCLEFAINTNQPHVIGALAKEGPTAYDRFGPPTRSYSIFSLPLTG